jgi:hypothetical protein
MAHYDRSKKAIQEIVDMPDRQIDLFIRVCLQDNGRPAARPGRRRDRIGTPNHPRPDRPRRPVAESRPRC